MFLLRALRQYGHTLGVCLERWNGWVALELRELTAGLRAAFASALCCYYVSDPNKAGRLGFFREGSLQ